MNRMLIALAGLALVGCTPGSPAPRDTPADPVPPLRAPSVYGLLGERERLELTSGQVAALDSIGLWLATETQRVEQALRDDGVREPTLAPDTSARLLRGRRTLSDETRALFGEVEILHRQAIDGVQALLTPAQLTRVCSLQSDAERARKSDRGSRDDAARPAWSWCPASPRASAA